MRAQAACDGDTPNGVKSASEECDDGNTTNTDACTNACKDAVCGDGIVRSGSENCDQGALNGTGPGKCDATCQRAQTCGDGFKDGTEACDTAGDSATCDSDCTARACGDDYTNGAAGEACDDGTDNGAGEGFCLANCSATQICGNGVKNGSEQCDDNNVVNTDACTAECKTATCGDGIVRAGPENCDQGALNGTGPGKCDATCQRTQTCGDGFKDGTEACDTSGESATCDDDCTAVVCGDGNENTAAGETCDDGNTTNANGTSDQCDGNCKDMACGNGIISYRPGPIEEECDGGNTTNGDGCNSSCEIEFCGNGVQDGPDEACDDGDLNGTGDGFCLDDCSALQTCGNLFLEGTEECEVGPGLPNTATCDYDCTVAECGDGLKNVPAGEQCDDGNLSNNDGCDNNCTNPGCGNGVVSPRPRSATMATPPSATVAAIARSKTAVMASPSSTKLATTAISTARAITAAWRIARGCRAAGTR